MPALSPDRVTFADLPRVVGLRYLLDPVTVTEERALAEVIGRRPENSECRRLAGRLLAAAKANWSNGSGRRCAP